MWRFGSCCGQEQEPGATGFLTGWAVPGAADTSHLSWIWGKFYLFAAFLEALSRLGFISWNQMQLYWIWNLLFSSCVNWDSYLMYLSLPLKWEKQCPLLRLVRSVKWYTNYLVWYLAHGNCSVNDYCCCLRGNRELTQKVIESSSNQV